MLGWRPDIVRMAKLDQTIFILEVCGFIALVGEYQHAE
jgi:hypothetical protein